MKMIFIILLILSNNVGIKAETHSDSCLKFYSPNDYDYIDDTGSSNPDSVILDTCTQSFTYGDRKLISIYFYYLKKHSQLQILTFNTSSEVLGLYIQFISGRVVIKY